MTSSRIKWLAPTLTVLAVLAAWQAACSLGLVPSFMLPSPVQVAAAIADDAGLLASHAWVTLAEALAGLAIGVACGFLIATCMDRFRAVDAALSPLVIISQTVPTVAIAPLLVLWLGYGMMPKVLLVALTTFFPITVSLAQGFRSVDADTVDLMRVMGASWWQTFRFAKVPAAAASFFAGLRISATYAVVGAVVAEWLGGFEGLGVYMTRVRKSYSYDQMFAAIIIISALSLALMGAVKLLERACMPWRRAAKEERDMKRGKTKRGIAAGALTALLCGAMVLGGCAGQGGAQSAGSAAGAAGDEGADGSLEKLTLVLDYVPNTNHTGIYVAIDKGYYADAGIELEVVQPPDDGADALVGSGKAQLGISFQDVMANYLGSDDPLPVTAIAAIVQHNTSGIMSRQGEGIDHAAGLAGHEYGTWDQDVEKAILKSIVTTDGGSWDEVALVPSNSTDETTGLRTDAYDAVWVYEAWALQNAKLQDYPVDYFSLRSVDETFDYYTPVIIANDAFLDEQPEVAAAFLAATEKGYRFASEHSDEAAGILVAYAPETDPELAKVSQDYLADLYVDDAPQWGYIDPERWDRFYAWMGDEGLIEVPIAAGAGFTNEFLPEQ